MRLRTEQLSRQARFKGATVPKVGDDCHTDEALNTFRRALTLSPRNVPLTMRYAEALLKADQAKTAHAVLLDLFNNVAPSPEQIRFTALAASSAAAEIAATAIRRRRVRTVIVTPLRS